MSDKIQEEVNATLLEMLKKAIGGDETYTLSSITKMSCLMKTGAYRNKSLFSGQEFLFAGVREGKKAEYIFEFTPVDAQEFTQAELPSNKVFQTFPELEARVVKAMTGSDDQVSFDMLIKRLRVAMTKQAKEDASNVAVAKAKAAEVAYEDNAAWGMF